MTELDFDELDKAVNSLMAENGKPSDQPDTSSSTVPEPATPAPLPTTPVATSTATPVSPAVRRRGQFMDVIRPATNRSTPAPVNGKAMDIVPPTMQQAATLDDAPAPVPSADTSAAPESSSEVVQPQTQSWPDPIDMAMAAEAPASLEAPIENNETRPKDAIEENTPEVGEDPLTSPFLPDAKVEKRPLGGNATAEDETPSLASVDERSSVPETPVETAPAEVAPAPEPTPAPLPDELQQDVVAVEANEVGHEDMPAGVETQPQAAPELVAPAPEPVAEVAPDTSTGTGSITQQYQEQPSTGDQTNGAIYDTSTYHQPLDAQPHKKKSSPFAWVLWIVVLLIVGAAAGAAWFYFTTQ